MNWIKSWSGYAVLIGSLLYVYSCTKISSTEIGTALIPAVDNINTFDTTLDLSTENFFFQDSALPRLSRTTTGGTPETYAGYISDDPQFGKSTASMFMFFSPPQYPFPYQVKDSLYFDSVVLCLRWSGGIIGDTNRLQKLDVFKLTENLVPDSAYKVSNTIPYSTFLGSKTFAPSILDDSVVLFNQRVSRQLRIRLSDDFGRELLKLDTAAGQPLHQDSIFRRYLPGFAVVPDVAGAPGANALMGFQISDTNSYLRIYYRYDTAAVRDTTFKTYRYSINAGFANNISRNYTGSEFAATTSAGADSIAYIQTAPGTYSVIRIPALNGFKALKGNVVIHKAEIVMRQVPAVGQNNDIFTPPEYLYMDYLDSATGLQRPLFTDGFLVGAYAPNQLGGTRKYVTGPGGGAIAEYRFSLSRYVQSIVTNSVYNNPLYLYAPYYIRYNSPAIFQVVNRLAEGRVKVGGGSNKQQKMVMRIIYSKI